MAVGVAVAVVVGGIAVGGPATTPVGLNAAQVQAGDAVPFSATELSSDARGGAMTGPTGPRDAATRKADTLAMWSTPEIDVWVATASAAGEAHLVPLSLAWTEERLVVAVQERSRTARDLTASGRARLAVGPTRDVTMVDAVLERVVPTAESGTLGEAYAAQADWDPRGSAGYVYLVLRPERVQAWREADEIAGRTLMRDGAWLV